MTAHHAMTLADFFEELRQENTDSAAELSVFFQQFEADYRNARSTRAITTPHLDVLRVFGLEFAELRHSDVLAWFLKPTTEHEQGPRFANALLRHLCVKPIADENYTVLRERHDHTDVALYASGRFAIFIENKVRHFEGKNQVSKMVESLVRVCRDYAIPRELRFAVFLTDKGAKPVTGPDGDSAEFLHGNLKSFSRVQLFQLFRSALEFQRHSPLLMNFLDSYLNAICRLRAQLS
jgi:hypothetical protein